MTDAIKPELPPLPERGYLGDDASYGYDESDMRDYAKAYAAAAVAAEHAIKVELLEALQDVVRNVTEAMKTGGWVPTPLRESLWSSMATAYGAIAKAT